MRQEWDQTCIRLSLGWYLNVHSGSTDAAAVSALVKEVFEEAGPKLLDTLAVAEAAKSARAAARVRNSPLASR
jgi:2-methylcitrate dehydratase PrpD